MMPKAPGLFSITNGWPRIGRTCSPTIRITMSVALPGPKGTTTLIGFTGYLSWAAAAMLPSARQDAESKIRPRRFMFPSLLVLVDGEDGDSFSAPMQFDPHPALRADLPLSGGGGAAAHSC